MEFDNPFDEEKKEKKGYKKVELNEVFPDARDVAVSSGLSLE